MSTSDAGTPPRHIAIIMDGNGRWARKRGLPRHAGHKAGLTSARRVIEHCAARGVESLTLFTFSSENWQRPEGEVSRLMELFLGALGKDVKELHGNGIRVRFIGDRAAFSAKLQQGMAEGETLTAGNRKMTLNVAVGYGGRWDVLDAARRLAREGRLESADESTLGGALSLGGQPDPDLFIRTGGEQRISNFLLWNLAYSELYFCDTLWPDFDTQALDAAFAWFATRQRRFGLTQEQVQGGVDA